MSGPVGDLFECTGTVRQKFRFENTNRYRWSAPSRSMGLMSVALRSSAVTRGPSEMCSLAHACDESDFQPRSAS
jgi:hypothetical protein